MEIMRSYAGKVNLEVLERLTKGICKNEIISNEIYLGVIGKKLRAKSYLKYDNWDVHPAVGIYVEIINTEKGVVDSYYYDFGIMFAGNSSVHDYWICENRGWYKKEPAPHQLADLAYEIEKVVGMYKEANY